MAEDGILPHRSFLSAGAAGLCRLDELATCLAHEFNPPLAIIGLSAGNALRDISNGEAEAAVQRLEGIVVQVHRAAGIIEKLCRVARAGQPDAPPAPVPPDEAVANVPAPAGRGWTKQGSRSRWRSATPRRWRWDIRPHWSRCW